MQIHSSTALILYITRWVKDYETDNKEIKSYLPKVLQMSFD